jgi:hypothetical protein
MNLRGDAGLGTIADKTHSAHTALFTLRGRLPATCAKPHSDGDGACGASQIRPYSLSVIPRLFQTAHV